MCHSLKHTRLHSTTDYFYDVQSSCEHLIYLDQGMTIILNLVNIYLVVISILPEYQITHDTPMKKIITPNSFHWKNLRKGSKLWSLLAEEILNC